MQLRDAEHGLGEKLRGRVAAVPRLVVGLVSEPEISAQIDDGQPLLDVRQQRFGAGGMREGGDDGIDLAQLLLDREAEGREVRKDFG